MHAPCITTCTLLHKTGQLVDMKGIQQPCIKHTLHFFVCVLQQNRARCMHANLCSSLDLVLCRTGQLIDVIEDPAAVPWKQASFNFYDKRIMGDAWLQEARPAVIKEFFRVLAVCHTVIPDGIVPCNHISVLLLFTLTSLCVTYCITSNMGTESLRVLPVCNVVISGVCLWHQFAFMLLFTQVSFYPTSLM